MTHEELRDTQLREDKQLLGELEHKWLMLELMKVLAATPFEKYYWAVRERQTDEQIDRLQTKMIKRHL